ncbi:DUF7133 domain-containing protein [Spirosoma aerolatum]|uniref:DUF7133 domain-containing protein n=1 Tax=Spirosoma aerolatum TaxID=1211326 RepID=UPI0009AE23D8|nr:c-type cytochrome [Spirosoma aerolatum]
MKHSYWITTIVILSSILLFTAYQRADDSQEDPFETPRSVSQTPTTVPLSPEASMKTFRLPKGYHLELVASEPMISEPVALAWDGNARLYVAQMETYMQTVLATGQNLPKSRIMLLEDTNGDGKMDKSSVFLKDLLLPRAILCIGHELLVNETDSYDIYAYQDTNGDGKADKKRPVFQNKRKAFGNVEHQRSGLDWNLDNWIYETIDPIRYRYKKGVLKADTLPFAAGQWGLTHDDYGRVFFSRAASGIAASGFQINPAYGQLDLPDAFEDGFNHVWSAIKTPDVNGGPKTLRPDSTMADFTSICGQSVFRGDRLPKQIFGDYIVAEPVARIIRRANIKNENGKIRLYNVYHQDEFISSTDMNFRPINTYTGPDGCLYIVDMYRGIIQESTWAQPGSYLYAQIMSKGLNKNIDRGRIYRLVYDGIKPSPAPKMLNETTTKLVTYLDHPNGWWRDNAQKEIIVRNDKSSVTSLRKIALGQKGPLTKKPSSLARIHALWTLEGLDAIDKPLLLTTLSDPAPEMRKMALWLSEPWIKTADRQVFDKLESLKNDTDSDVLAQLLLSLSYSKADNAKAIGQAILARHSDHVILTSIERTLKKAEETRKVGSSRLAALLPEDRKRVGEGKQIFTSLCSTCHGPQGEGTPTKMAPHLAGKFKLLENRDEVIKIMLNGLTGPVDGVTYHEMMPPMGTNSDEWIASVLTYVRLELGMQSFPEMSSGYMTNFVLVKPEQVKKIREQTAGRTIPWTWDELIKERDLLRQSKK